MSYHDQPGDGVHFPVGDDLPTTAALTPTVCAALHAAVTRITADLPDADDIAAALRDPLWGAA